MPAVPQNLHAGAAGAVPASGTVSLPLWDAHLHAWPREWWCDPLAWAARSGEPYWGHLVTQGPQGWATLEETVAAMDTAGVERAVLQGWYWQRLETCRRHNDWMLEAARAHPGRFSVFATTQPAAGEGALAEVERAVAAGAVGVGELCSPAQGYGLLDNGIFAELCAWLQARQLPLCLHVTEAVGHAYPGRVETPLAEYLPWVERFATLRVVLAHWGGGLPFFLLNPRIQSAFSHVWLDTAASPRLYDTRVWAVVLACVGAERILWGSDFPLRLYPGMDAPAGYARFAASLAEAPGISAEAARSIGSGNLKRLLQGTRTNPLGDADA